MSDSKLTNKDNKLKDLCPNDVTRCKIFSKRLDTSYVLLEKEINKWLLKGASYGILDVVHTQSYQDYIIIFYNLYDKNCKCYKCIKYTDNL